MNKSRLTGAVFATALIVLSNTSHAALVNTILGLDIGGTLYDVTFHTNTGDSFTALWDADNDGVFGGGASVFTAAPHFWGDAAGAFQAAGAIVEALGTADTTTPLGSDSFLVPFQNFSCANMPDCIPTLTSGIDGITSYRDNNNAPAIEDLSLGASTFPESVVGLADDGFPYVSFAVTANDSDSDGIVDLEDNCIDAPNGPLISDAASNSQVDTDGDGYGNMCDGDLNNDGNTNTLDLNLYKLAHRTSPGDTNYNVDADFNGDVVINTLDLNIYKGLHRKPPGPSCCGAF
jgi:hypothetical protein